MELAKIPAHVPQELVYDFDMYNIPGLQNGFSEDIHALWKQVQDSYPRIFWTPRYGGYWMVTRYPEIERLCMEHETFSNREPFVPKGIMAYMIPVQLDPPEHGKYRALLMPAFTPAKLTIALDRARRAAVDIIEELKPQGGCDFWRDFASVMPVVAFLHLIDLPEEDAPYLRGLSVNMTMSNPDKAREAWAEMGEYVRQQIELRKAEPRDDLISSLIAAKVDGKSLTDEELFSLCILVLSGGLDTVVNLTSFTACFLAQSPAHRRELIEHPERIDNAVEEFARRFGSSNLGREVRHDTTLAGVQLRKGDIVVAAFHLAGLDENVNPDPMKVDFTRDKPKHLNFGLGPHTCIGNRLAKREIRIFLEEWLARIPDFQIASGKAPKMATGLVNTMLELPLTWNPEQSAAAA